MKKVRPPLRIVCTLIVGCLAIAETHAKGTLTDMAADTCEHLKWDISKQTPTKDVLNSALDIIQMYIKVAKLEGNTDVGALCENIRDVDRFLALSIDISNRCKSDPDTSAEQKDIYGRYQLNSEELRRGIADTGKYFQCFSGK